VQLGELRLGIWVEDLQRAEVDGLAGFALVGQCDCLAGALSADAEVTEELLGLCTRTVKFLLSQPGTSLFLGLVFVRVEVALLFPP